MASGTVVFSMAPQFPEAVPDSSCSSVRLVAYQHNEKYGGTGWTPISCSTDPVNAGTIIYWAKGTSHGTWSVNSITATPSAPAIDNSGLVSLIITCSFIFLFFIGFHTGSQNGNR